MSNCSAPIQRALMLFLMVALSGWSDFGIDRELRPIAMLESSYGKFITHQPSTMGKEWTAVGPLGLKPIVAFEACMFVQRHSEDKAIIRQFGQNIENNWVLYNLAANAHWHRVRKTFPSLSRAVFAWRWGITAAKNASDTEVENSSYVIQYNRIRNG